MEVGLGSDRMKVTVMADSGRGLWRYELRQRGQQLGGSELDALEGGHRSRKGISFRLLECRKESLTVPFQTPVNLQV